MLGDPATLATQSLEECLAVIGDAELHDPGTREAAERLLEFAINPGDIPIAALVSITVLHLSGHADKGARLREMVLKFIGRLDQSSLEASPVLLCAVVSRIEDPAESAAVKLSAARVVGAVDPEVLDRAVYGDFQSETLGARVAAASTEAAASVARMGRRLSVRVASFSRSPRVSVSSQAAAGPPVDGVDTGGTGGTGGGTGGAAAAAAAAAGGPAAADAAGATSAAPPPPSTSPGSPRRSMVSRLLFGASSSSSSSSSSGRGSGSIERGAGGATEGGAGNSSFAMPPFFAAAEAPPPAAAPPLPVATTAAAATAAAATAAAAAATPAATPAADAPGGCSDRSSRSEGGYTPFAPSEADVTSLWEANAGREATAEEEEAPSGVAGRGEAGEAAKREAEEVVAVGAPAGDEAVTAAGAAKE